MLGAKIGGYRITETIGEGSMGIVYLAIDEIVGRPVALKMLRPGLAADAAFVQRFRGEAVTLSKLSHPNIVSFYNFIVSGQDSFMALEYVPGNNLKRHLQNATLPRETALHIFNQMLDATAEAHRQGVIHRDLKPANIVISPENKVKITDFGIACMFEWPRQTRTGAAIGTIEYMAPERIEGQRGDARSDLYALGMILYEMLAGSLPFRGMSEYGIMRWHVEQGPRLLDLGVDPLAPVVARALARNPEDRYESVEAMRAALAEAQPVVTAGPAVIRLATRDIVAFGAPLLLIGLSAALAVHSIVAFERIP